MQYGETPLNFIHAIVCEKFYHSMYANPAANIHLIVKK